MSTASKRAQRSRLHVLSAVFVGIGVILGYRLFTLQVTQHERFAEFAIDERFQKHTTPARRGALLALIVGAIAALYLSYIDSVATSGYGIKRLQTERDAWRTRNDQLRVELGKARSLTWVEHEAVGRLKMQRATGLTYLKLDEPGPAVAAPAGNTPHAQAAGPR